MGLLETAVVVLGILLVVAAALLLWRQGHPEEAADHEAAGADGRQGPTPTDYPPGSRPAGPGAELDDPDDIYGRDRSLGEE